MRPKRFIVFEHRPLILGERGEGNVVFDNEDLAILQEYYGNHQPGYFTLGYRRVVFNEHVGVLQVAHLTIEVLPKADRDGDKDVWMRKLIEILHAVYFTEISVSNDALLKLKSGSILEYYIGLFLSETKRLVHKGLIKNYRNVEGNLRAIKGKLLINRHVRTNIIHQERFAVRYTVYTSNNIFNQLLLKTLLLIRRITNHSVLKTSCGSLLPDFAEMDDVKVTSEMFNRLVYNRKTAHYKPAIAIAKLLLLNYHPDVLSGRAEIVALMFDMNVLWEKFIFASLCRNLKGVRVYEQQHKYYWKLAARKRTSLKPDIVLIADANTYVVDTKWKLLPSGKPAPDDLRQMYAYTKYFNAIHALLVYPGTGNQIKHGYFFRERDELNSDYPCSVGWIGLNPLDSIDKWQRDICDRLSQWLKLNADKS